MGLRIELFISYNDSGHTDSVRVTTCNNDLKVSFKPDLGVLQHTAIVLLIFISPYLLSPLLKHWGRSQKKKTSSQVTAGPQSGRLPVSPAEACMQKCKMAFKNMPTRQQLCHPKKKKKKKEPQFQVWRRYRSVSSSSALNSYSDCSLTPRHC